MTHPEADLRVRRTRKMIQEALIALIEERGFDAISVGDIAERAMINRATFYRHYEDKYDLTLKIFAEAMEKLERDMRAVAQDQRRREAHKVPEPVTQLFEHFASQARFYQAMLGQNGSSWFAGKIRAYLKTRIASADHPRERPQPTRQSATANMPEDMALNLGVDMFISTVMWWINGGCQYPAEQVFEWLIDVATHGYMYAMGYELPPEPAP